MSTINLKDLLNFCLKLSKDNTPCPILHAPCNIIIQLLIAENISNALLDINIFCRYYLKGPNVGKWDIFIENLPALVDNITPVRGSPGFWVAGIVSRYGTMVDFLADKPWIRLIGAKVAIVTIQ